MTNQNFDYDRLTAVLQHVGFEVMPARAGGEEAGAEVLLIGCGRTTAGEPLILKLFSLADALHLQAGGQAAVFQLQFVLPLPLATVQGSRKLELARLLLDLNMLLPLGQLCWNPRQGLELRYGLIWEDAEIAPPLVVEIIEKMAYAGGRMVTALSQWLSGTRPAEILARLGGQPSAAESAAKGAQA